MRLVDEREVNSSKHCISEFLKEVLCVAKEQEKKVVLVLVTRKGYWIYKLLRREYKIKMDDELSDVQVISDRYILKDFNFESIKDKTVVIFDDTINNGNKLFFFYSLFLAHGAAAVYPCVYAISTEFIMRYSSESKIDKMKYLEYERVVRNKGLTMAKIQQEAEQLFKLFYDNLQYSQIMYPSDIAKLSMLELKWIDDNLAPFIMDLPVFSCEESVPENKYITFSYEEWEKLCEKSEKWEFEENSFGDDKYKVVSNFFRLKSNLLDEQFNNSFFDFVVKCKYKRIDQKIQAVFVPFAIVRSFYFDDVWKCFKNLFEGTSYYNFVIQELAVQKTDNIVTEKVIKKASENHNWSRAIFRAVIYSISIYIGELFKEHVKKCTGKNVTIELGLIDENNVVDFKETINEIWENFDKDTYEKKLLLCREIKKVPMINGTLPKNEFRSMATDMKVEQEIHMAIIEAKNSEKSIKNRILTMEMIENIAEQYVFESREQKKNSITKAILLMLDSSCMGNEILFDNEEKVIYRGFKAGENCEILFPKDFLWVYVYAYALFYLKGAGEYKNQIENVMKNTEQYFSRNKYFPGLIDEDDFKIYKKYLIELKNPEEQIPNKEYLLDDFSDENINMGEKLLIKEAFSNVIEWIL